MPSKYSRAKFAMGNNPVVHYLWSEFGSVQEFNASRIFRREIFMYCRSFGSAFFFSLCFCSWYCLCLFSHGTKLNCFRYQVGFMLKLYWLLYSDFLSSAKNCWFNFWYLDVNRFYYEKDPSNTICSERVAI